MKKEYPVLKFQLLNDEAFAPTRADPGSSGLDVYTPTDLVINPKCSVLVPLGIRFEIPFGWDLAVYNKSGISTKKHLIKGAELIDSSYRGEVHVHLFNLSPYTETFKRGDKIAQLVMREVWMGYLEETNYIDTNTVRGTGGFGSSGK